MARPNVTVLVNDESFVVTATEPVTVHRAGYLSSNLNTLIDAVGTTLDRSNGFMVVGDMADWIARISSSAPVGVCANAGGATAFYYNGTEGTPGGTFARWPQGPTGPWKADWWMIHNYLQYGGSLVFGSTTDSVDSAKDILSGTSFRLDSVFGGPTGTSNINTAIKDVITARGGDCVGVIHIDSSVAVATAATEPEDGTGALDYTYIYTYGEKVHRGLQTLTNVVFAESAVDVELITSALSADVAGCLARTDRVNAPWYSPAGSVRGRILDVVRLSKELSETDQDTLFDGKVNPVVSFRGEGTLLFGDKTSALDGSSLSRINVARLFVYLKNVIGTAARRILFDFNDVQTRTLFVNAVVPVLRGIQGDRGISDFRVICDESNNTTEVIDANEFVADILVKPNKSINFITIRFTNKSTAAEL